MWPLHAISGRSGKTLWSADMPTHSTRGSLFAESRDLDGDGTLDFPAILRAAKTAGVQHFFVEQDQKEKLESRLPKLDSVVFQAKLGSVGDKLRRVASVAAALAPAAACDAEQAARAVGIAKADLETLIVGEIGRAACRERV